MNYNNKKFRPINSSENSEVSEDTVFVYQQEGSILTSEYCGGRILKGHLLGIVNSQGNIEMSYHQVNTDGQIMTGTCTSTPELLENGKIRLHEEWAWTSGDFSKGSSTLEEV